VQAFSATSDWFAPTGTLGELTAASHERAERLRSQLAEFRAAARDQRPAWPFAEQLRRDTVQVIAEVKRSSPSKGAIAPNLVAADQAARYVAGGAAAISVLTEPSRFGGSMADLNAVAERVAVPVIRKDFIVDDVQLWEARASGASAVLLIVRALSPDQLRRLAECAIDAALSLLVEVRNEVELHRALDIGAQVIGVNNRNLETLVIDPSTAPHLIPQIPRHCIAVAESGMKSVQDVEPSARAGADAILVGSSVSAADNPEQAVATMASVPRHDR
jgi:indole-3-glycerol phosphate synthase